MGSSLARRYIPILTWLPGYDRAHLVPDVVSALTVWALLVPEAMAYATIAGVPLEAGLYAAILPLFAYAVFGTSRQMFVGPTSTIAILSAATIAPLADGTDEFVALTAAVAVIAGAILIIAGAARMGWVAQFMARPVLEGFVVGLALVVIMSQLDKLVGIDAEGDNFWAEAWDLISHIDDSHVETALVGFGALALIFGLGRFAPRAPGALITVVAGIAISGLLDLESEGVHIVGDIPSGLPPFGLPDDISLRDIRDLLPGAFGIALVAYAESIAIAQSYASKYKYEVDANQELISLGVANVGAGLSQGFAIDGSLSKTAAADEAGQKTQMSALINGALVVVTAIALTGLFHDLPEAVLGAIVVHAVWHLIDVKKFSGILAVSRSDFWLAVVCTMGVLTLDILAGLIVAVAVSLLVVIYRVSHPRIPVLGKARDEDVYQDIERHPDAETYAGLIIVRPEGSLFFANAEPSRDRIRDLLLAADPRVTAVILDAEAITSLDFSAAEMLKDLAGDLADDGVDLWFARAHGPVRDMMRRSGLAELIGAEHFFPDVSKAVDTYRQGRQGRGAG
jgi:SulP family sulfate permease